jgi:hypothetical protein
MKRAAISVAGVAGEMTGLSIAINAARAILIVVR